MYCIPCKTKPIEIPSDANTPGQNGPGSNGNERVLRFLQSSSFIEALPFYCLVSCPEHSLGESYSSAENKSVYTGALADWASYI